ncbi:MAG: uroporphyrinogen decarboxylase family protein, partial [Anaerolineae bacterium]
ASDPGFVDALAGRVTDHLIAIGLALLRRGGLSAIAMYDNIAGNKARSMWPRLYRRYFPPQMARMVAAFKRAGARKVMLHSDGDIRAVLDDLVEIGIDAINSVEPRAGMNALALREKYGQRLALVGGLCNSLDAGRGLGDGHQSSRQLAQLELQPFRGMSLTVSRVTVQ